MESVGVLRYSVFRAFDRNYREMDKPVEIKVDLPNAPSMVTRRRILAPDFHIAPHWHGRAQFLFASSGVMRVGTPRRLWTVPPTRALWIPAGIVHDIRMTSAVDMRTLYIDAGLIADMPQDCAVVEVTPLMRELVVRATANAPSMRDPASALAAADAAIDDEYALLTALIVAELRRLPPCGFDLPLPESAELMGLCTRALADLCAPLDAQTEADRLGISTRTLYRRFLKETGLSFSRWLQQARLLEAVRRLAIGMPVTTVALDLGYQSPSAFTAMFHRALGSSPRSWRPQNDAVTVA